MVKKYLKFFSCDENHDCDENCENDENHDRDENRDHDEKFCCEMPLYCYI